MGMFDTIKDKLFCPFCGELCEKDDYQTKDLGCMLDSWTIAEILQNCDKKYIIRIYQECKKCKKWIEINIKCWKMT
jgi:hypothetical protein